MDKDRIARNLACVDKHFHSEAANEVEAALDLYTDDIIWEAPALSGLNRSFSGKQDVAKNYLELLVSMRDVNFQSLQRFATEDRVVDDSIVTFEIARAGFWPWPLDAKIEMRRCHILDQVGSSCVKRSQVLVSEVYARLLFRMLKRHSGLACCSRSGFTAMYPLNGRS
jgi:ketosteroid isomerase-like protein